MSTDRRTLLVTPSGDRLPVPGECATADAVKGHIEALLQLPRDIQHLYLEGVEIDGSRELGDDCQLDLVLTLGSVYSVSRRALARTVDGLSREPLHPPRSEVEGRRVELIDTPIPLYDSADIHRDETFQDAVRRAAPFCEAWSSSRAQRRAALGHVVGRLKGPVVVTSILDRRFVPFLENWLASCRSIGIDPRAKTLLLAADEAANKAATDLGFATLYQRATLPSVAGGISDSPADSDLRAMTLSKLGLVEDLLEQDREILYQDMDVVWLRDPVESLRRIAEHDALDALFMNDGPRARFAPKHYDSGFFYLRNNTFTRAAWKHVTDRLAAVLHLGSDQAYLNQLLPALEARGLRAAALDDERFVNGHRLVAAEAHHRALPSEPEVVHVSWTPGRLAKIDKMKRLGYWYADAA